MRSLFLIMAMFTLGKSCSAAPTAAVAAAARTCRHADLSWSTSTATATATVDTATATADTAAKGKHTGNGNGNCTRLVVRIPADCITLDLKGDTAGLTSASASASVPLGDAGAVAIAAALVNPAAAPAHLTYLWLDSNLIGPVGATALARALATAAAPPVAWLGLGSNKIGDAGAAAFGDALAAATGETAATAAATAATAAAPGRKPALPSLEALLLFNNGIGDAGAMALAAGIEARFNAIGGGGGAATGGGAAPGGGGGSIGGGVACTPPLRALSLASNFIGHDGVAALKRLAPTEAAGGACAAVSNLDLSRNNRPGPMGSIFAAEKGRELHRTGGHAPL